EVTPAGRAPVEHGDRVPVGPVEVLSQVAQQLEAPGVSLGLDPDQDVGAGRRLRLEVPPDHRGELVERVEHREVQVAEEVGREHQAAMPVNHERFHVVTSRTGALARVLPCPIARRRPGAGPGSYLLPYPLSAGYAPARPDWRGFSVPGTAGKSSAALGRDGDVRTFISAAD